MTTTSFNHEAVHAAVRISIKGQSNTDFSVGTGFFYADRNRLLLISNKHVLKAGTGTMTLALNQINGTLQPFIFEDFRKLYFGHPDNSVDLACVDVTIIENGNAPIKRIGKNFLDPIDYEKVALGSDVLFVGYPDDYYDDHNNLPLVRKGTLASLPSIDFRGKGDIVIDAQVFSGSSGSPVFVDWDGKYRLLGVISNAVRARTKPASGTPTMLGLGIVIKQRHVKELIDSVVRI